MKTLTFTLPWPFFFTCFLSFLAFLPFGFTASLNEEACVIVNPICLTEDATALVSGGVLVWFRVICPGPETLAPIAAVPFFFFLVIEVTVILFAGAAAGRHGSVGPEIRLGCDAEPRRWDRPMKSLAPELPQNRYCELAATPQTALAAATALGTKLLFAVPPATGARPIAFQ